MSKISKVLGSNVRLYRKSLNLTQDELSSLTSIEQSHIARIEKGEVNISLDTLERLSKVLKIDPVDLLYNGDQQANSDKKKIIEKINVLLLTRSSIELQSMFKILKEIFALKDN
ncbi:helix-turn-helix domain-containing protein [Paenibacillus sacheonensis]|uniref:Helix-turn-helix domain-containing protein n=1 Tax=Paenibacillus sacheonensis TaxID=742054 RepID=A0A7X4YQQ2_9BACL|nr:transcriptional regulator with XRE-family HTH domain [Paenibacillus sacheonensis]NBC70807.1 helix-turn-helix domain-containing protein [Paenibacillus sacheonensis]